MTEYLSMHPSFNKTKLDILKVCAARTTKHDLWPSLESIYFSRNG